MIRHPALLAPLAIAALLSACGREEEAGRAAGRPVEVVVVAPTEFADTVQLTGDIQARKDVDLAFRIGGKLAERSVNVGDSVKAGQVVARLDAATERNALDAAKATLAAARGEVATARSAYERQQALWDQGFTTRPRYDQARQAYETAQSRLEDAEARVDAARDRVGFTELRADASGVVTARGAEPGEVVQPGRMVLRIARDDGRDAVFDVPTAVMQSGASDPLVQVALVADPTVTTQGRVREVSPQADPVTRTFRVRVGLDRAPEAMRLGATVNGSFHQVSNVIVAVPARALTALGDGPAVWIVDPAASTVSLRPVDVLRFDADQVVLGQGLEPGETVVTAGVQALRPGQKVKPLPISKSTAVLSQASPP
ncbi:MAG: efflux RND transporter periplasmic adaptor subunit [Alsobacter sp.]